MKIVNTLYRALLNLPLCERWNKPILEKLGAKFTSGKEAVWISNARFVGDYHNLSFGESVRILDGAFILCRDKVIIGDRVNIAYGATILTSSNAETSPFILSHYPAQTLPVVIKNDVWIGSNATILGGGNFRRM